MWYKTRVSEKLGIKYPIVQGPFGGGLSSAKLVSAVSNAGGLVSFGLNVLSPEQILTVNNDIRKLTYKPYALNLWVSNKDEKALNAYRKKDFDNLKQTFKPYFDELNLPLP